MHSWRRSPPLVSIGLPVRNGAHCVAHAIADLLGQDYPELELLISDNASTDGTPEVCGRFAADPRVQFIQQGRNIGALANFGAVLSRARGDFFMWAACDDRWHPSYVSKLVQRLQDTPDAVVAMSAIERVWEATAERRIVRYRGADNPERMPWLPLAVAAATGRPYYLYIYGLYRTSFLRRAFANFPSVLGGDKLFVAQVAMAGRLSYVDEVLHTRLVASQPLRLRFAQDEHGREWGRPLATWATIAATGPYLARSRVIPLRRKLAIPLLVLRVALADNLYVGFYNLFSQIGYRLLGDRFVLVRAQLRQAVRRFGAQ